MKKLHLTTWLFSALLLFTACEADDNDKLPSGNSGGRGEKAGSGALTVNNGTSTDQTNKNKNVTGNDNLDTRYEIPHIIGGSDNYILVRSTTAYGINYIIEWNNTKKAQRWTAFQMYNGNSGTSWKRDYWAGYVDSNEWVAKNYTDYGFYDPFQPDPDLPTNVRTELSQYKSSSYQRGHIVASQDRVNSKDANEQTFYLSNIMPQSKALNTGTWQNMESQVRKWNDNSYRETLYVVKGGTIDDNHITTEKWSGLTVPDYFFMGIVSKLGNKYRGIAFILEHSNPSKNGSLLKNYVFTIDQLEQLTGIDFFCNLPDDIEDEMEKSVDRTFWGMN